MFLFGKNKPKSMLSTSPSSSLEKLSSSSLLPDPRDTEKLRSMLYVKSKFSTNRCGFVLPKVKEIYYTELPNLYTAKEHESRVYRALQLFYTHARGPMLDYYKNLLIEEFSTVWLNGRRRCEAQSLTGHFCKYPVHQLPTAEETSKIFQELENNSVHGYGNTVTLPLPGLANPSSGNVLIVGHCTDYESIGACNCGKSRKKRLDPFSLVDANCNFFQSRCCERFTPIELPKTGEFHNWSLLILGNSSTSYDPSSGITQDGFKMRYKKLVPFEVGHSSLRNPSHNNSPSTTSSNKNQISDEEFPSLQNSNISRGKVRGRRNENQNNHNPSPSLRHTPLRSGNSTQQRTGGWIGYEYECPSGHRFIEPLHSIQNYAAQGNIHFSPNDSFLTIEAAFKTEMPLFSNCRSKSKTHCGPAQLQRVFICSPINLAFKMNPRVQVVGTFSGTTKKLTFSIGQLVAIPNDTFVCLRLPYVFEYENTPILLGQHGIAGSPTSSFRLVF